MLNKKRVYVISIQGYQHETPAPQHREKSTPCLFLPAFFRGPKAFSLLAGALERSGSTPTGTLRMELMQGLVKMAWGSSRSGEVSSSRGIRNPPGATGTPPGSGKSGGSKKIYPDKRKITKAGSSKTLERSESADSARWSEVDIGNESGDGNVGNTSLMSAPPAAATRGKAGGARDIFSIPNTEEVSGLVWM